MPGRVTPTDVTTNFDTELTDSQVQGWIDMATQLVDDIAAADDTIAATRLEQIELALTRHFAHAQAPRVESSGIGDSTVSYQGETGMGITATHYGQQAAMLDPTGLLTESDKPSANIHVPDSRGVD